MSGMTLHDSFGDLRQLWRDLHSPPPETLRAAMAKMRGCSDEGARLARVLDTRKTHLVFSPLVAGGFTLNPLNAIFLDKGFDNASGANFDLLVALLAHEARHIEQGYWVDSIAQELNSYQTQARIAAAVGVPLDSRLNELLTLNPALPDLTHARELIVGLFPNSPAQVLYQVLSLQQPRGLAALPSAVTQIRALSRAASKAQSA